MSSRGKSTEGRGKRGGSGSRGGWNSRARGGHGRGRGKFPGNPAQSFYRPPEGPISRSSEPLGPNIDSINIKTLLVDEESPKIENCEYVASYNWSNGKVATILVPGSPPAWTPPATDSKLNPDSGAVFRDVNAARWPQHPLEPALRSLQTMRPDFDLASVDIFGCGHTLGYLLKAARSEPTPFRFDVDVVGDVVFFVRKGSSPTERITDLRGYGFRFPSVYTTWDYDVRDSASHQRTISYNLGGLQILLRSGTDGYLPARGSAPALVPGVNSPLEDAISTLEVGSIDPSGSRDELHMEKAGSMVPQSMIFDIKTRAGLNSIDMKDVLPGLWLNQTPNFLVAYHQFGLFRRPQVRNIREDILDWEKENSHLLATFHAILKRIVDVVRDSEKQQCEVSWGGTGELLITEQIGDGRRALPSDLQQLFAEE